MGKDKSILETSQMEEGENAIPFEERVSHCTDIAKPMCSKKGLGRIRKLIKKAAKAPKTNIVYGTKSVQRILRKGVKEGIVLISGMVRPVETLCHIPSICEEKNLPYIYVPSNEDLQGGKINRAPVMIIYPNEDYSEVYNKVKDEIESTPLVY